MLFRDPKCVYVANTMGQAHIVAGWLQDHGITAEVMHRVPQDGLGAGLALATGVEVWVAEQAQAAEAIHLLGEHAVDIVTKAKTGVPLDVVCEECGESSTFPAQQRGTVQSCPHCSAYIDVEDAEGTEPSQEPTKPEDKDPDAENIMRKGPWDITS